ncbi:MAG: manganese efflux pump [Clostridia bacterium]|nr:manganese efflux pump [Clostridia bacterium]
MNILGVILIGVALSIDACALTIANCATYGCSLTKKKEWLMPITFAIFQGVMPVIGYFVGYALKDYIGQIIKYISAGIFLLLALKIIVDIIKESKAEKQLKNPTTCQKTAKLTFLMIVVQAVATSVDALAIGVTFINLEFSVFIAVTIISVVTFIFVSASLLFGKYLGKVFGKYAEWVGAVILIILAVKSFIEAII